MFDSENFSVEFEIINNEVKIVDYTEEIEEVEGPWFHMQVISPNREYFSML